MGYERWQDLPLLVVVKIKWHNALIQHKLIEHTLYSSHSSRELKYVKEQNRQKSPASQSLCDGKGGLRINIQSMVCSMILCASLKTKQVRRFWMLGGSIFNQGRRSHWEDDALVKIKEVREGVTQFSGIRGFQPEGTASAKTRSQEYRRCLRSKEAHVAVVGCGRRGERWSQIVQGLAVRQEGFWPLLWVRWSH